MRDDVYAKVAETAGKVMGVTHHADRHAVVQAKCAAMIAITRASRPAQVKSAQALPNQMSDQTLGDTMRKWLTPSNVLGAAAGLGGVHLLGKSLGINPWKLALGAGALYGGYKLFQNPHIRELVDLYGNKAMGYLGNQLKSWMPKQQFDMHRAVFDANRLKFAPQAFQDAVSAAFKAPAAPGPTTAAAAALKPGLAQ